jgi:hypothetical protein
VNSPDSLISSKYLVGQVGMIMGYLNFVVYYDVKHPTVFRLVYYPSRRCFFDQFIFHFGHIQVQTGIVYNYYFEFDNDALHGFKV